MVVSHCVGAGYWGSQSSLCSELLCSLEPSGTPCRLTGDGTAGRREGRGQDWGASRAQREASEMALP